MKQWISLLSGLLIAQLVLAVTINLAGEDYGAFQAEEKLLAFNPDQVDGLHIEGDAKSLLLEKREGRWQLPENGGFPADQDNVKRLLDKLTGLEKGWPVATSSGAARRFKVAEDEFQRKLVLLADDESLAELYVGTSPGFRKVHVRPEGEDAVYGVSFNTWEANAKADDWIDKEILKLDESKVAQVEMPDYVLHKTGESVQIAGLTDQEKSNAEEISSLLSKLTGLRIQSLLGSEEKPEYKQDTPELEIKIARTDADPLTYRFSKPEEDSNYYVLKRSDLEYYFKIPEFSVKPIREATREKLVQSNNELESGTEETVGEPGLDNQEGQTAIDDAEAG